MKGESSHEGKGKGSKPESPTTINRSKTREKKVRLSTKRKKKRGERASLILVEGGISETREKGGWEFLQGRGGSAGWGRKKGLFSKGKIFQCSN